MTTASPSVVVLAGPNGAGKTTAARTLLAETLRLMTYVNADVIAQGLSGFDPESIVSPPGSGAGLHGMRERAKLIGAELSIASTPGTGSTVPESETTLSPARAMVARDLAVRTSTPIPAIAFIEVQLIINNGTSLDPLNCSLLPGGQTCTDTSSAVSIPAGSELTLLLYEKTFDPTPLPAMSVLTGFRLTTS